MTEWHIMWRELYKEVDFCPSYVWLYTLIIAKKELIIVKASDSYIDCLYPFSTSVYGTNKKVYRFELNINIALSVYAIWIYLLYASIKFMTKSETLIRDNLVYIMFNSSTIVYFSFIIFFFIYNWKKRSFDIVKLSGNH